MRFADVSVKTEFFHGHLLLHWPFEWRRMHWVLVCLPQVFTSSTITFTLSFQCQQAVNMEKAEKLRSAQSFPFLCHSPRSSSEHRGVPLRKSVSVSELVARWVADLLLQVTIDLWLSRVGSPSSTSLTNKSHSDKDFPKYSITEPHISSWRQILSCHKCS